MVCGYKGSFSVKSTWTKGENLAILLLMGWQLIAISSGFIVAFINDMIYSLMFTALFLSCSFFTASDLILYKSLTRELNIPSQKGMRWASSSSNMNPSEAPFGRPRCQLTEWRFGRSLEWTSGFITGKWPHTTLYWRVDEALTLSNWNHSQTYVPG